MNEDLNCKYSRLYAFPFRDWHNTRKSYKKGITMHPYYKNRIEEATIDSFIVIGAIILAAIIVVLL
jgi:hypothetical protein